MTNKMSKVFQKLEELYICITNDCYLLFLEKNVKQDIQSLYSTLLINE